MRALLIAALILGMAGTGLANDIWILETNVHYPDLQAAVNAATAGQTIRVAAGTYTIPAAVNVNKAVTIKGDGAGTILEVSGTGNRFNMTAANAALESVQIKKTDKTGVQNIIYIGASNVSIKNNLIWGQFIVGDGDTSRAMEVTGGLTGLLIEGNTIHNLRQPAYINKSAGTVRNNYVYATKGWVISDGSSVTFEGNTWGAGANANAVDIAIIVDSPSTPSPAFYGDLVAVWLDNNQARIDDQRSPAYIKYVDGVNGNDTTGSGGADKPYKTIAKGINTVAVGGGVVITAGTYPSVAVSKSVTLLGANAGIHPAVGTHPTEQAGVRGPETILGGLNPQADNITVDGIKFLKAGTRVIDTYANANNLHLTNCIVESTTNGPTTGIVQLGGGSHTGFTADFNLFKDRGDHTFYFGGGPYDGLNLSYNRFNVEGDCVFWAATPLVDGLIQGNEFDGTIDGVPGAGFATVNIGQAGNIVVRDNWCHDVLYTPFQIGIVSGSVLNNVFERIYPYSTYGANALELWGGQWGTAVSTDVTIDCNTISYNDIPAASAPTHAVRLRAPESGAGIDGSTIHLHNNVFVNGGARSDAFAIRHQGNAATAVDAENNWWGITDPAAIAAMMSGNVDSTPALSTPPDCQANVLYLEPTVASIYVQPSESVTVNMNVANLAQAVNGCQALLNFSSTYFKTGPSEVTVAAGGGLWNELLYNVWTVVGDLDVAVGVDLGTPGGTSADAKIAYMTLTPTGTEGTTRVVFRADGDGGYATMLSDLSANPVWPIKIDSANIIIDGTAPTITAPADATVTAAQYSMVASASDTLAGIESFTMNGLPFTSPTQLTLVPGTNTFTFVATDRAGNVATQVVTITYNQPAPAVAVYRSLAPNKYGSPSWTGWLANAVAGALDGGSSQGGGYEEFAPFTSAQDYSSVMVSGFKSWKGLETANSELGTAIHFVWRLDNGVQSNPGAAKLDPRNISISFKDFWLGADSAGDDAVIDYSGWWNDIAASAQFGGTSGFTSALKGYNWDGANWVEVTSGTQADLIIYGWFRYAQAAYSNPPASNQDALNELYKQMAGSVPFAPDPRQTLDHQEMEVTYTASGVGTGSSGLVVQEYQTADAVQPVVTLTTPTPADAAKLNVAAQTIAGTATDNETLASGIREVKITLNSSEVYSNTVQDNVSFSQAVTLAEGSNTIVVTAKDFAGNTASTSRTVLLDTVAPVIENLTAVQTVDVLDCENPTLQGLVNISVEAGDDSAGLVVPPTVTVSNGVDSLAVTYVNESPAGTFNYTVTVGPATSNGNWTINASAADEAGNTAATSGTLCVNKNQVTGTISFATLSPASYSVTRDVVLVATDGSGAVLETWTIPVQFTNAAQVASGSYTLTDVPDGIENLSARSAWQLRKRQAVTPDLDGQAAADFVLLGGDIKQDNFVNILDYSVLKGIWGTTNSAGDINGDGTVGTLDYSILKANWFKSGDVQ